MCWAHIAQWLERRFCIPLVMGSTPGCRCGGMGTLSIPQSDNPQSATRMKDYFRRSQIIYTVYIYISLTCLSSILVVEPSKTMVFCQSKQGSIRFQEVPNILAILTIGRVGWVGADTREGVWGCGRGLIQGRGG